MESGKPVTNSRGLLATSLAGISPLAPFPYMYYPWALTIMVVLAIIFRK